jgi:4-amino-4-deoxy-L-arabinose transferase-like glycosyltransferase
MTLKFYLPHKKIYEQTPSFILILFILASVGMRFFSFFPSLLGHDESTYMIIGRDILNGKLLYTDVTDTKPVGIFLFYAMLEFLFGSSIFMKRLAFSILVGITSFLIFKVSKKLFTNQKVAFASGIIYIF